LIKDYLIVAYLTAIAGWPVTLTLTGLCRSGTLYGTQGLGVVLIVLCMLVAIAAWQFEHYM
jgi:hypothetical protein